VSVSSSAAFLALVLLTGANAIAQPRLPDCEAFPSRIELTAEPTDKVREVCISPERPITFRFDSPLVPGSVDLRGHERFEDVSTGTRSFNILPPADLHPGERFVVAVRFADSAAPTSATFELVGHPALGTRQVDVYRRTRTVEDYQQEVKEKEVTIRQLRTELERTQGKAGEPGLTWLIASKLMKLDHTGVKAEEITRHVILSPSNALRGWQVFGYRSTTSLMIGEENVVRVAVAVMMFNPGTQPWTVGDAVLVGKGQELKQVKKVWQRAPIVSDSPMPGEVVVEADMTEKEAQGTFTLTLWDESGMRLVTVGNVTFP
jgi:uncharacterized protein (TIGR02268 family)